MLEFRPRIKGVKGALKRSLLPIILLIIVIIASIELIMLLQRQRQLINLSYLYVFNVLCKPLRYIPIDIQMYLNFD